MEALGSAQALLTFGAFAIVGLAEGLAPRRAPGANRGERWRANLCLGLLGIAISRSAFPLLGLASAAAAAQGGHGLLNDAALPAWLAALLGFLLLDLSRYASHVAFHRVPALWRLHRLHHADPDVDLTTALRAHPLEGLVVLALHLAAIALLGIPPLALAAYLLAGTALSVVGHGNVAIPQVVDRALRRVLVTPDMHRVHHSARPTETNANYSTVLSVWDRLFRTYRAAPEGGHEAMQLGLPGYGDPRLLGVARLLADPFLAEPAAARQPVIHSPPSSAPAAP